MARDYAKLIGALLAHAEDEGNSEEARQSYRDKAEKLMAEYRVEQEEALATDPGSALPIVKRITLLPTWNSFREIHYPLIFRLLADHTECKTWVHWVSGEGLVAEVAGYEGDIRYLEFLWTAAHLMFATRIDPTWDDSRTESENIFLFRNAGIERRAIADRAWGVGAGQEAKNRSKVQRIYLAEAARRGEQPRATGLGFNTRQYREAYAREFIDTLSQRLWLARQAANAAYGQVSLANRSARVVEALYEAFPDLRPSTAVAEPYVAPNENCDRCKKAASGYCREHQWLKPRQVTEADRRRWDREANSPSAMAGRANGRQAAEGVQIQRGAETPKAEASNQRALS